MSAPKTVDLTAKASSRDPKLNLDQRMLLAMQKVGYIPKAGTGPEAQGSYKFARVEHIKDAVRDALIDVGVMVYASLDGRDIQLLDGTDRNGNARSSILATVWGTMTAVNVDDPEQTRTVGIHGQGLDNQDKALSKATTSADKYGLLTLLQIPTGDDPDSSGVDVPGAAPRSVYAPPANPNDPGAQCPKHHKPWRVGNRGYYCSSKDESGPRGYCGLHPTPQWEADQRAATREEPTEAPAEPDAVQAAMEIFGEEPRA